MSKSFLEPLPAPLAAPLVRAAFVGGSGGSNGVPLIANGYLHPGGTFTRASAGTAIRAGSFLEFADNVPRFGDGLVIEGDRTNNVRNPRCEDAVTGSPGTAPTHWAISTAPTGLTRTITAGLTLDGMQGMRVRYTGTPTANGIMRMEPEPATSMPALNGETHVSRIFYRVTAGDLTNITLFRILQAFRNGGGGLLTSSSQALSNVASVTEASVVHTATDALTAHVNSDVRFNISNGGAMDLELEIYWFTCEQGAFASTPILPPVGFPAVSTRLADSLTLPLASLGIPASGQGTYLFTLTMPQNAPTGVDQTILEIDDGSLNNRYMIRNIGGGATIVAGRVIGGVLVNATSAGTMAAGTSFKIGVTLDGTGRIASCLNAGTVEAATGGPTVGLTTLRAGINAAGGSNLFGSIASASAFPNIAVSDATLQALLA